MIATHSERDIARFMSHVDRSGGCWLWTAVRYRNGYGKFSYGTTSGGTKLTAPRIDIRDLPFGGRFSFALGGVMQWFAIEKKHPDGYWLSEAETVGVGEEHRSRLEDAVASTGRDDLRVRRVDA